MSKIPAKEAKPSSKKTAEKGKIEPAPAEVPQEVRPVITVEELLTGFADQIKAHFQATMEAITILKMRQDALERQPHGEVAAALEAMGNLLRPYLDKAFAPTTSYGDIAEIAKAILQFAPLPGPATLPVTTSPPAPLIIPASPETKKSDTPAQPPKTP